MSKSLLKINEPESKHRAAKPGTRQILSSTGELEAKTAGTGVKASGYASLRGLSKQAVWDLPFRPWFLAAACLSVVSIGIWISFLQGHFGGFADDGITPLVWHIHEMLFGFGATVAVAFLLTAAQTWTGKRSLHGGGLIALTLVWLSVRVLLWSPAPGLQLLAIGLQALWWLGSIGYLASMLVRARSRRNYQFIPLLGAMMLLNLGFLLADFNGHTQLALHLARSVILLFGLMVGIVGGRVIPFFTGRGAEHAKVVATPLLDKLLPPVTLAGVIVFFTADLVSLPFTPATLLIAAGVLHLLRLWCWDPRATLRVPLLWSLHASYLALGLGLVAIGASYYTDAIRFSEALHLITVGTIGGMILAMMARVSLGHTGRPLQPHPALSLAFGLILLGALARVGLPLLGNPAWGWSLAALCWILSFGIFLWHYTPILCAPRKG
ncbi:NnrS family protein [Shewanella sp. AS16]|uniref:NnrS family protein n=1 Tax=Shewanella sp. AS16 TaxID=2907625 RepID=UPI001F34916B|nr:NnrS family protein [Shewanella sp. AS16]MCE9688127.1 NnrS family protein [Shewanella sp. AS16]